MDEFHEQYYWKIQKEWDEHYDKLEKEKRRNK